VGSRGSVPFLGVSYISLSRGAAAASQPCSLFSVKRRNMGPLPF